MHAWSNTQHSPFKLKGDLKTTTHWVTLKYSVAERHIVAVTTFYLCKPCMLHVPSHLIFMKYFAYLESAQVTARSEVIIYRLIANLNGGEWKRNTPSWILVRENLIKKSSSGVYDVSARDSTSKHWACFSKRRKGRYGELRSYLSLTSRDVDTRIRIKRNRVSGWRTTRDKLTESIAKSKHKLWNLKYPSTN